MDRLVSRDTFLKRQEILPKSMQNIFFDPQINEAIGNAITFAQITDIEEREKLMDIIRAVLLFIIPRNTFKNELQKRMQISPSQIAILDQIIQQRIFEPLKDELSQLKMNQPEFTFQEIPQKETITPRKPLGIPEAETIKTEEIKELVQEQKPLEAAKTEVITKKEILQEEVLPDLSLPEIPEIKIERPVDRTGGLKKIIMPSTSPEAQEKIHSKLMEAMNKKEVKPKIVEEMKKVVIEGIKKTPQQKPKPKTTPETEESITSQVIGGEGKQFTPQEKAPKSSLEKPYIFDVKLKEEPSVAKAMEGKEEEKKEALPKGEIKYQRPSDKPFGEA